MKLFLRRLRIVALSAAVLFGPATVAVLVGAGVVSTQGCAGKTKARLAFDTIDGATSTVQGFVRGFGVVSRAGYGTDAQKEKVRLAYAAFQKAALSATYLLEIATTDLERQKAREDLSKAAETAILEIQGATDEAKAIPPKPKAPPKDGPPAGGGA